MSSEVPMGQSGSPRRILVVIDPASLEQPALDKAARMAARGDAALELHVCDVDEGIAESWTGGAHMQEYRALREQRQLQELERLAAPLRARGLRVECSWQWHAPLELGIGHHVIRTHSDLVVKGTHRHVPLPRGSASHADWHLICQVPVPLLLVHPRPWPAAVRIAAAVDPCHPADRPASLDTAILEQAHALADATDGALEVLHVLQSPPHLPGELRPDVLVVGGTVARILEAVDCDLLVVKPPGFVSPLLVTD